MESRIVELKPFYHQWLAKEGIPVYEEVCGIEDITELPRQTWARLGGRGTFIELKASKEERTILYVAEIPPGAALEPEKHLYEELIYVIRGRGLAEVWHEGKSRVSFEWGEESLFAMPLNTWHRLVNGGREPVLFLAKTNAPAMVDTFRNTDFVFNCPYNFTDRFSGQAGYFTAGERQQQKPGEREEHVWVTNFVPNVRNALLDSDSHNAERGQFIRFEMASWGGVHSSEWPVGVYRKAHYHGPGAVLVGLKSVGYVLLWDKRYGIHPYQDGNGDKVVRVNWKTGSIYSPQRDWFHQHFNTGKEPARHLALRLASKSEEEVAGPDDITNLRYGGRLIEYEDEDPEIRRMFREELRKNGVKFTMKPLAYRTDPLPQLL